MAAKSNPIKKEEDVKKNPDPHIGQDFPGFPNLPADKKSISPKTKMEKKSVGTIKKRSKKRMEVNVLPNIINDKFSQS